MKRACCLVLCVCALCACTSVKDVSLGGNAKSDDDNQTATEDRDAAVDAGVLHDAGENQDHHEDDEDDEHEAGEKSRR